MKKDEIMDKILQDILTNTVGVMDSVYPTTESMIGIEDRLDYAKIKNEKDVALNALVANFILFYDDAVRGGAKKEDVVKIILEMQRVSMKTVFSGLMTEVIKSTKNNIIKLKENIEPPAVESNISVLSSSSIENKKLSDFKSYLRYASDKYGSEDEKKVVESLIKKIK